VYFLRSRFELTSLSNSFFATTFEFDLVKYPQTFLETLSSPTSWKVSLWESYFLRASAGSPSDLNCFAVKKNCTPNFFCYFLFLTRFNSFRASYIYEILRCVGSTTEFQRETFRLYRKFHSHSSTL
jgi:hypothetical protein